MFPQELLQDEGQWLERRQGLHELAHDVERGDAIVARHCGPPRVCANGKGDIKVGAVDGDKLEHRHLGAVNDGDVCHPGGCVQHVSQAVQAVDRVGDLVGIGL